MRRRTDIQRLPKRRAGSAGGGEAQAPGSAGICGVSWSNVDDASTLAQWIRSEKTANQCLHNRVRISINVKGSPGRPLPMRLDLTVPLKAFVHLADYNITITLLVNVIRKIHSIEVDSKAFSHAETDLLRNLVVLENLQFRSLGSSMLFQ